MLLAILRAVISPMLLDAQSCTGGFSHEGVLVFCRTDLFAAEARSADQAVMKLRQEVAELKAALASSQAECNHLRQQMKASSRGL